MTVFGSPIPIAPNPSPTIANTKESTMVTIIYHNRAMSSLGFVCKPWKYRKSLNNFLGRKSNFVARKRNSWVGLCRLWAYTDIAQRLAFLFPSSSFPAGAPIYYTRLPHSPFATFLFCLSLPRRIPFP